MSVKIFQVLPLLILSRMECPAESFSSWSQIMSAVCGFSSFMKVSDILSKVMTSCIYKSHGHT